MELSTTIPLLAREFSLKFHVRGGYFHENLGGYQEQSNWKERQCKE